ncbi:sensor histidine kinase [Companilactobacillus sp.]|uniref:sensor histidine kinase n=1 Tax=Companilactobacillus sp. TaxID=2767905 RepID=UPI00263248FE|nr:sensor histidine kinase [Companilactobacillus sp.]
MKNSDSLWIQKNFLDSPDATLIVKGDKVVIVNNAAQELIHGLNLDVNYLIQLVQTDMAENQSTTNNCFNCVVKETMHHNSIPIDIMDTAQLQKLTFSLDYYLIDDEEDVYSIVIRNNAAKDRLKNMEDNHDIVRKINRTQENERKRISEDLHDSVAQSVYSSIMTLNRMKTGDTQQDKMISQVQEQLRGTLSDIKGLAVDVRPAVLDNFGLTAAIHALVKRMQPSTDIELDFIDRSGDLSFLSDDIQTTLYRIVQEAVTNAIKHSEAETIVIMLVAHKNKISLEVIDDGIGFNMYTKDSYNGSSLGMINMNERVKSLNGYFLVDSKKDEGTTITAEFPYENITEPTKNED